MKKKAKKRGPVEQRLVIAEDPEKALQKLFQVKQKIAQPARKKR